MVGASVVVAGTDILAVGVLVKTPLLLAGTPSLAASVTTVALIASLVVGVPLMVQTMLAPAASVACGDAGSQVATKPAGKPFTVQLTSVAIVVDELLHVTF
jgi:hypothetical protein